MTLHLDLNPELEATLRERAAAAGKDPKTFVLEAVLEKLQGPRTFADILAPVHRQVLESGMSDEEINSVFQEALRESRRERRKQA